VVDIQIYTPLAPPLLRGSVQQEGLPKRRMKEGDNNYKVASWNVDPEIDFSSFQISSRYLKTITT